MKKMVRVYYTTFVDVEYDTDSFENEQDMLDYAEENADEFLYPQDVIDNLSKQVGESEIIDI